MTTASARDRVSVMTRALASSLPRVRSQASAAERPWAWWRAASRERLTSSGTSRYQHASRSSRTRDQAPVSRRR
ncbi:hypothetical protein N865_06265 [Intrasporangium oryzae NRRL B-24470]|uniref:Uncharacterized protein n=1 Tax=Intrasporangium oryzae NRRL B-24470 TaxID=1386089 RepID=W9GC23_9MICO|nr:hypothetical protein N865_06265 [Intrasporangium oryzae NRRL B-24470]